MKLDKEAKGRLIDLFAQVSDLPPKEQFQYMMVAAAYAGQYLELTPEAYEKESRSVFEQLKQARDKGFLVG